MIDHFTISVADYDGTLRFYTRALKPLGYGPVMTFDGMAGFGPAHKPTLWIKRATPATTPQHIAFVAASRALVDAFHEAALAAGATDDGKPGLRPDYHPDYYGAFVIDPLNGHPIEAVCHLPVGKAPKQAAAKKAKASARTASRKKPAAKAKRPAKKR